MKRFLALLLCLVCLTSSALAVGPGFSVYHGERDMKRICITVDDCKDTAMMKKIFDLGQSLGVKMTFFTLGYVLEDKDRAIWQEIAASDCEIGNHCYWHQALPGLSSQAITATLNRVQARLDEILGYHYPMQVMRPPFGELRRDGVSTGMVLDAIERAGYSHAVLWDVSQTDPEKCYYDVQNGSILLFHTIVKDYNCLAELLPRLQADGYEFVTVSEMLGLAPVATSTDIYVMPK